MSFFENIKEVIDNEFIAKDVSELVVGDYYLFNTTIDGVWFYKDGVVFISYINTDKLVKYEYTSGTLQEFIDNYKGELC